MSSRGRQHRANVGSNSSPLNRSSGRLVVGGSTTRSSSGSPSSRTRSLAIAPSAKKPASFKKMSVAKSKSGNNSPASNPAPITAKRRSSAEERRRKSRRPKFQDNPPAPEIVEKKVLQLAEQASREELAKQEEVDEEEVDDDEEEVEEEEEEVDDDEDAAVRAASEIGCDINKVSSNGVHTDDKVEDASNGALTEDDSKKRTHDEEEEESTGNKKAKLSISQSVSSLVDDIVKKIDAEPIQDDTTEDESEEELDDDHHSMVNGEGVLHKQLLEAVKDLSDPNQVKECLITKLKAVMDSDHPIKLDNPAETFSDIVAESSADGEVRTTVVDELVSTYLQHRQDQVEELKMDNESTSDSFPPELVPQVDGVDSSAEGKSDDPKEDAPLDEKEDSMVISATKNELIDSNDDEECDETMKTANNHKKCDKSKILSEMENKFAKETQNALKNKPTYKRRNKSESWELTNGKSESETEETSRKIILMKEPGELEVAATDTSMEMDDVQSANDENNPQIQSAISSSSTLKTLRKFRKGSRNPSLSSEPSINDHDQDQGPPVISKSKPNSPVKSRVAMSPPPLTPEVGPSIPLRIDIPDHYNHSPSPISSSSFSSGYSRRLVIRTPPAARAGLVTMVSEAVLSKEDAEVAATAVQLSPPPLAPVIVPLGIAGTKPMAEEHPSLKIRLPKNGSGPSLVITSTASSAASVPASLSTPHHKKVPKRRNLESDGGLDLDFTEEEEPIDAYRKKKKKELNIVQDVDQDKLSADEMEGGKTSPDSQITTDDRQAIMVPEKASSFNIHPERTCSDCCFYCRQKFGLFDTPLHISQMKSLEIQKFAIDYSNCSKDACLCDKCYRLVDRNARNMKKESEGELVAASEKVRSCFVRNCNKEVTHTVSKKWLHRLKKRLIKKLNTDWDRIAKASMKSSFPVCNKHNNIIEYYSNCGLCKKKLSVNAICCLRMNKAEVQELNELLRADSIPAGLAETMFVCKLCKTFCGIKQKAALEPDYLKNHKNHKLFIKEHKRRLYSCLGLDSAIQDDLLTSPDSTNGSPTSGAKTQKKIHQVSQSDNPTKITIKTFEVPSNHHQERPSRKRRQKEFASPNSDSRIFVVSHDSTKPDDPSTSSVKVSTNKPAPTTSVKYSSQDNSNDSSSSSAQVDSNRLPMCSITISFDLNTQKLWDDLHLPYETYTSFFRHLILLEKYFRNGDLVLSENASQKASSYIRSLQNRIEEYEVKHKRSHADLSACTRPDLSVPAAPGLVHFPLPIVEPPTTRQRVSAERETSPAPSTSKKDDGSTILRIPKVSMPNSSSSSEQPPQVTSPPPMPTKIRVRSDLMYIGLMAKGKEMEQKEQQEEQGKNLMQLLNDPTLKQQKTKGPSLGATSLVASSTSTSTSSSSSKSSNSQLFKNSETSGSSAIPLTFNNSIAEVLAAAAKSKSMSNQQESTSKPEVTITKAKSKSSATWTSSSKATSTVTSASSSAKVNPLMDMSKLLQNQAPGIPPHIVAQNTLAMPTTATTTKPISTHQMAGTMPKIAPKPTSSLLKPTLTPSPSVSAAAKSTSNLSGSKKSLNTVLDRLSGLSKSTGPQPFPTSSPSSLVQQLQAPPILANPGLTSPTKSSRASSTPQQAPSIPTSSALTSQSAAMQSLLASQGLLGMGFPGASATGLVGQPMVQYPWASASTSPAAQQAALAETQRALTLAGAGLPGMNQAAAQAAQHEIMKFILQAQQQGAGTQPKTAGNSSAAVGQAATRPRAPPPLTLMGRAGNPPQKPHKPD